MVSSGICVTPDVLKNNGEQRRRSYLIHVDVVEMVFVIDGFEESLQLPHGSSVDHKHERHPDWVLHFGQIVVYNVSLLAGTGQDYRTQDQKT